MRFNTLGFSTPRALAFATLASVATLGVVSGVFGTFSTTIIPGQSCTGYGYFAGYGYGYDCSVVNTGGGGGGGGAGTPVSTPLATPTGVPTQVPTITPPPVISVEDIIATDISRSIYRDALEKLISEGVMQNNKKIRPNSTISRAEFMKLLALANGYKPLAVTKKFRDLPQSNTLTSYVNFGVANGWVNVKNTNFRPNDIITQGEIDKLIATINGSASADTIARKSGGVSRGKAAADIVKAFY